MSISSLLGTAKLALSAQQLAIETTSHNVANAGVDGYTRQRASLAAHTPLLTQWGSIGTGVVVKNVERLRDSLLDVSYRDYTSQSSSFSTRTDVLSQVSGMFDEPSSTGLAATFDQFWSAWADLANMPNSSAAKSVVQQRGQQLASSLNRFAHDLESLSSTYAESVTNQVTDLNRSTSQIADLNRQIIAAESNGTTASDLRDSRDRLIDGLAQLTNVRVIEQPNGAATVYIANATVVDGVTSKALSLNKNSTSFSLTLGTTPLSPANIGGSIGATLTALNTDIPNATTQLDTLANQLVTTINTTHRTGWTAVGDTAGAANWDALTPPTGSNIDFFDATKTTAASIHLSAFIESDAAYIAVGNIENGSGNNTVATQLSQLRDTAAIAKFGNSTQSISFGEFYRDLVTRIGVDTNDADMSSSIYKTLAYNADTRRASVSGVSTDEELIALTTHQQAYAAAAKVVTTADSMAQTILDMVR